MTRRTITVFLCILIAGYVSCNLIKPATDIGTKDVPLPREDIENNDLTSQAPQEVNIEVMPLVVIDREPAKTCAKIGESCTFHGECCTRACLGYFKKCVSSANLYPDYVEENP